MSSISRSKIDENFGGNFYGPCARAGEQFLPVLCMYRVVATPLSRHVFRQPKIGRQPFTTPSFYDFSKAVHSCYYGAYPHQLQGAEPQCYTWLNRGKYPL